VDKYFSDIVDIRDKENYKIEKTLQEYKKGYRTSLAIVGEKGSGKSTILNSIKAKHNNFSYISICSDFISNPNQFISELCKQIDYYPPKMYDWKLYADNVFEYIANDNKKYVFLIDDIQYLVNMKYDNFMPYIRNKYQELSNLLLIVAFEDGYKKKILAYDKPFFGQFEVIELKPLIDRDCEKLIDYYSKSKKINRYLYQFVCQYSEGNPLYIKLLSKYAVNVLKQEYGWNNTIENLEKNINEYISIMKKEAKEQIQLIIADGLSPQVKGILSLMANHDNITVTEIARELYTSTAAISTQLKRLCKKGLIVKERDKYKIKGYIKLAFELNHK